MAFSARNGLRMLVFSIQELLERGIKSINKQKKCFLFIEFYRDAMQFLYRDVATGRGLSSYGK